MSVPCTTINKVCGSGLKAVMLADSAIRAGEASCAVAGGMESMSQAPYLIRGARSGLSAGDQTLLDANLTDGLLDAYGHGHMANACEHVVSISRLSRQEQDHFAFSSYQKALRAVADGSFASELISVEVPGPKGESKLVTQDEIPRETSLERLGSLKPSFGADGTITAGNASKLSDGAAAVVVMSGERAARSSSSVLAEIVAQGQYAGEPQRFVLAPVGAVKLCLKRAGWATGEVDLFEINEAFSAIEIVRRELDIPEDRFNVNGGAVALGHPIGASGARLLVTLLYALRARGKRRGIVSLCLGGGEAVALAIEVPA